VRFLLQGECWAELPTQVLGAVAYDIQTTATRGALEGEGSQNRVSAELEAAGYEVHIGSTIRGPRQEVKHRAIVPHVVRLPG
jgi:hypothetical protein